MVLPTANTTHQLLLWDNGVPKDVGGAEFMPSDVNSSGEIVGTDVFTGQAWLRRDGVYQRLSAPEPPWDTRANAINSSGMIAGDLVNLQWPEYVCCERAVVWAFDQIIQLPLPSGFTSSRSADIDDDGTVIGSVDRVLSSQPPVQVETLPIVWFTDGTWRLLPASNADRSASASSIRNGVIAGTEWTTSPDDGQGVRWNARSGGPVRVGNGAVGTGDEINAAASVLMFHHTRYGSYLVQKGRLRTLSATGYWRTSSLGLTDSDVVYGYGSPSAGGQDLPLRWNCGTR